jgi:DNA-binding transcriptional LysR family regulator
LIFVNMNNLDLTTLRLFIAVCDSRSISRVAEREKIDASAITRRINKLESQAGQALIKRIRNGVEPTPEGLQFCEMCREFVQDAARLSETLTLFRGGDSGRLSIAATSHAVAGLLISDLSRFMKLPDANRLTVAVQEMTSPAVVQAVRDGRFALGVYWDNVETSGLETAFFYTDSFCCVVAASHPLAQMQEVDYAQITQYKNIGMRTTRQAEAYVSRVGAIGAIKANYVIEAPTHEAALRLVAEDLGVFVTSQSVFNAYRNCWNLVGVPVTGLFPLQFRLVYRSPESLHPGALRLIKHLSSAHVNQQPEP